ncbi:MAG: sigma-70 family RNA polymerase sigma factor [Beduini sp.]|uniref:sigma-70 family RNA polymerase sigma factor n=1 Tax=Beduini sp. TaxID=1922300 RepID=UPI0011C7956D
MKTEAEIKVAIETYGDMIRRICFLHLKQYADVEDIFQNVFFKYATKREAFDSAEHEKAWLIRVTINACHDFLGSWFKKKAILTEDFSQFQIDPHSDQGHLLDIVMTLSPKYRDLIYLHYYEGYKIVEIAALLKKNENTIHTRLRRAKQELREKLGGDYFD